MALFSKPRTSNLIGLFGKIPIRGDFIASALPRSLQDKIEEWIRSGFVEAQQDPNWNEAYLCSPIWQFAAARGFFDGAAWCGVIMPSVDSVGRYFPLVIAVRTDAIRQDILQHMQHLAQTALSEVENVSDWQTEILNLGKGNLSDGPTRLCCPSQGAYFQVLSSDGELLTRLHEDTASNGAYAKLIGAYGASPSAAEGELL